MAYRETDKAINQRSERGVLAKERKRLEAAGDADPYEDHDPYIEIRIYRRATGETAVFECTEGDRIDNYTVVCNGILQGIQSISTLTANIRKALPRFRRVY